MKKNVLMKGILVLIVIAFLTIGFVGCAPPYPTTGTVYIVVYGGWYYNLYMDYDQIGWSKPAGTYLITPDVPIGNHFFQAIDTWGSSWGYYSVYQYIHAGNNYVYLYP
ncbi:MAG: hypothetical protein KAW42_06450 [Candidatus Atribacteria bacterium]|nr:hypothetical protein [Candidatus Atribacteria bacterium]